MTFWSFLNFWFWVFGVIFEILKFLKMAFLIFFNSDYSLISDFLYLRPPYMTFWSFWNFWFWVVFGVICEFLKFSKMAFLLFFNSDYSLFSDLFCFEASLHDFLKFFEFLVFGCFWGNFWVFKMFNNVIFIIFQFWL